MGLLRRPVVIVGFARFLQLYISSSPVLFYIVSVISSPISTMLTQASILVLILLSSLVSALALNNVPALATGSNILTDVATLIPTTAPQNKDLRRRQEAQKTFLAGPDATCGFIGGNASLCPLYPIQI